jgi:hypothetical protein
MIKLKDRLVISGPFGEIFFELLQIILILHIIFFYYKNKNIIGLLFFYGFLIHVGRLYLNFNDSLNKLKKYKLLSLVSFSFLLFMFINKLDFKGYQILFGLLYATIAVINFLLIDQKNKIDKEAWDNRKIFYFIPLTIFLGYLSYLNINNNILPLIFGDFIYHFIDLIYHFYYKN